MGRHNNTAAMPPIILLSLGLLILCVLFIGSNGASEDKHEHEKKQIEDTTTALNNENHDDHEGHDADAGHEGYEHGEKADEAPDHDDHEGHDADAGHEGHDHGEEAGEAIGHDDDDGHDADADCEGHEHGEEAGDVDNHADHAEDGIIHLSPEAVGMAGITVSHVEHGHIEQSIELPGEVGFDEDHLVLITPRFEGIAQKVNCRIGDYVEAGDVVAVVESNESMNTYDIKAPISGWIIARRIVTGEFVSQENSIFILADLSTVWVNLAVYPKDADHVRTGMQVDIAAVGSDLQTQGTIAYVSPIIDISTRSLTARIILQNNGNDWRPGTFVRASVATDDGYEGLLVKRTAVQILDGESVVFVLRGENQFEPVPVRTGDYDAENIIVTAGLATDTEYVSDGAFELKAKIVTSNLDPHAGHGH